MPRTRPLSMRSNRKSKIVEDPVDLEATYDPESFAWKRKYRESLNDIDLATRFAEFMSPELSKSFLEHNREEFENVLESKPIPTRPSTMYGNVSSMPVLGEEPAWQDLDITSAQRNRKSVIYGTSPASTTSDEGAWAMPTVCEQPASAPRVAKTVDEQSTTQRSSSSGSISRRQRMLRPVKSFVSLIKRPSCF